MKAIINMKKLLLLLLLSFALIGSAYSESVYVKYRGNASLDNFNCTNTSSSIVHRICHQPQNSYVIVLLGSTYYHYCRVPSTTVNRWLSSYSKGSYYHSNIKGRFDCRLGGIPKE
jgi:hypothetical protein